MAAARGGMQRAPVVLVLLVLALLFGLAEAIRRVPPAEETQRRLAEEGEGGNKVNREWCLAAGFNPALLKCATCDKLAGVVLVEDAEKKKAGQELVAECRQCCQEGGEAVKYARAVVECDEFFLKFLEPFKKLKASDEAAAWEKAGTLQFKIKANVRPNLLLFAPGEDDEPAETVGVASWTTESILEFLHESIPPASASAAAAGKQKKEKGAEGPKHEEL